MFFWWGHSSSFPYTYLLHIYITIYAPKHKWIFNIFKTVFPHNYIYVFNGLLMFTHYEMLNEMLCFSMNETQGTTINLKNKRIMYHFTKQQNQSYC